VGKRKKQRNEQGRHLRIPLPKIDLTTEKQAVCTRQKDQSIYEEGKSLHRPRVSGGCHKRSQIFRPRKRLEEGGGNQVIKRGGSGRGGSLRKKETPTRWAGKGSASPELPSGVWARADWVGPGGIGRRTGGKVNCGGSPKR